MDSGINAGCQMMSFPFVRQYDTMDCGPACLKMVAAYYKSNFSIDYLRKKCFITNEGVSFLGLSEAADSIGFKTLGVKVPTEILIRKVPLPCIVHWRQKHFVVVYKIKGNNVWVADPSAGIVRYSLTDFENNWAGTLIDGKKAGLALIMDPTPSLNHQGEEQTKEKGFKFLLKYFSFYKKYLGQLLLGLFLGSAIQLAIPFLTQSVIDIGINNNDIGFIYLVLFAQLALIMGRTSIEFIRGWLLLQIGSRVNVSIISGFLQKLMSLPIAFFDTRLTGDILQRIEDNNRIEDFLTSASLSILFSFVNLIIFGIVLAIYNTRIFLIFLAGSALYILWISLFMKKRARLDNLRFREMAMSNSKLINIINGMQEIKLSQCELNKRWDWEEHQAALFGLKVRGLNIIQYQSAGAVMINEIMNIMITIISAATVISGEMTLGMMLAVQFIIGQLNIPVNQIIGFFRISQDTKMSLDRLAEVHNMNDEETDSDNKIKIIPDDKDLKLSDVSFQYEGPRSPYAVKDINLLIERNKITAIVGLSGSGKTTLLKLILGFYAPVAGKITVGETPLNNISLHSWRRMTGAVMQDGFIFPGTISGNIAPGTDVVDEEKLVNAAEMANIREFIESLPLGYNTKIGTNGHGLSEGQKQRLLIARVIYKNPEIIVFDEATNSLDANTEKTIVGKLTGFFKGKTVIIVAHRLSTVKYADNIVVLENGHITESGDHETLVRQKGVYFNLVRNQLELGK